MEIYMNIFCVLLIPIAMGASLIGLSVYRRQQSENMKAELYKLVEQTGASHIWIEKDKTHYGVCYFALTYKDAVDGNWQARQVSIHVDLFGQELGEFTWDKPLISGPDPQLSSRLSSKE